MPIYRIVIDYQSNEPLPKELIAHVVFLSLRGSLPDGRIFGNTVFTEDDLRRLQQEEAKTEEDVEALLKKATTVKMT